MTLPPPASPRPRRCRRRPGAASPGRTARPPCWRGARSRRSGRGSPSTAPRPLRPICRAAARGRQSWQATARSLRGSADRRLGSRRPGSRATALRRPPSALASRRSLRPRGGWAGRRTRSPASSRRRPPAPAPRRRRGAASPPAASSAADGRSRRYRRFPSTRRNARSPG